MRYFYLTALLFLSSVYLTAQVSAAYGAPKFAPADGKKMLFIGQDNASVGGQNAYQDGYIDSLPAFPPAGVTTYTSLPSLGGLRTQDNWGAGPVNGQTYLVDETFDNASISIGLYLVNQLSAIAAGSQDQEIRSLASWVKEADRPVFLRIGYEFDGPWNNYVPSQFIAAWRHIVQVFDEENVRNVAYVWQSAGINTSNMERWWPGDEYVNWVGYSHFDISTPGVAMRNLAELYDKPIMIAEATPRRVITSGTPASHWNAWFAPLFSQTYANDRIKALAYINANWDAQTMWIGQGWGNSRVQDVPEIKANWEIEMAKSPWLLGDEDLFEAMDFNAWQDSSTVAVTETLAEQSISILLGEDYITVVAEDGQPMDGVLLLDASGRTLYTNTTRNLRYELPARGRGVRIVSVRKDGREFSQLVIR